MDYRRCIPLDIHILDLYTLYETRSSLDAGNSGRLFTIWKCLVYCNKYFYELLRLLC